MTRARPRDETAGLEALGASTVRREEDGALLREPDGNTFELRPRAA